MTSDHVIQTWKNICLAEKFIYLPSRTVETENTLTFFAERCSDGVLLTSWTNKATPDLHGTLLANLHEVSPPASEFNEAVK